MRPSGERYLMEDFYYAGGVPALMAEISDLLQLDALTVSGATVAENIAGAKLVDAEVIARRDEPLAPNGGLVVLRGNLCPDGAILKRAEKPLVIHTQGGFFSTRHQYLVSYKGFAFHTKSATTLVLPSDAEVVEAEKIWVP